jgi:hypothetical protein|eukprot:COSAG02_NODE_4316_length_5512_cov_72.504188_2_plen_59_part_00
MRSGGGTLDPPSESKRNKHSPFAVSHSNAKVEILLRAARCSVQKIGVRSVRSWMLHLS